MSDDIVIPLFAIGMPMLLVGTILALKHLARHREMRHRERMRAIELGLPHYGGSPGAAIVCTAIGAGVPVAACFFAMLTSIASRDDDMVAVVWAFGFFISLGGLIAGYRLTNRLFLAGPAERSTPARNGVHAKDVTDPDLYDVVGRRG